MKRIPLYILLLSYSALMLKPVSPYISDTIAHIFYYAQHMATVHYENGKFHVHKEVIDVAKEEAAPKDQTSSKKDNSISDHLATTNNPALPYTQAVLFQSMLTNGLPDPLPQAAEPPPDRVII
ncbi:MAG TPA: hypothetical protein PKD93_04470 [Ferruginibacter sp.]|nr:hypothetical protein [Ferruginibacter sp.]HNA16159.1 hypothetical protein [Ferruginibacter sp.]HNO99572.1 hypothetical protein [Ferruginibacter sp.]